MASRTITNINSLSIADLLVQLKALVVIPVAEALSAWQAPGELFWHFWARVQDLTIDCNYTLACAHAARGAIVCGARGCAGVDFTDSIIKDVLLAGIHDSEIRQEILGDTRIDGQ